MSDIPSMSEIPAALRERLTPDGRRLLEAVEANDDRVELSSLTNDSLAAAEAEAVGGLIRPGAIYSVAMLRAAQAMADIPLVEFLASPVEALAAIWADGVMAGIAFQQRGGRTES